MDKFDWIKLETKEKYCRKGNNKTQIRALEGQNNDVAARCRIQAYSQETTGSGAVWFKFECGNSFKRAINEGKL